MVQIKNREETIQTKIIKSKVFSPTKDCFETISQSFIIH